MIGYFYTAIFVFLTAISMVFIHHAATILPPALTLFYCTIIAIVCFHCFNIGKLKSVYQKAWQTKWLWLKIMISVSAMWLATIYGPAFVSPAVYILIYFAINCLCGLFFSYLLEKEWYLLLSGAGVFVCTLLIILDYLHSFTLSKYTIIGILLGLTGGIANFIYSKQSYALSKKNSFTTTQILAVRFWLLLPICFILLPKGMVSYLTSYNITIIAIIALTSLILPIFFLLKGILAIGAEKSAILCGVIPAITYILQAVFHYQFNVTILLLNLATGVFIALPYAFRLRHPRT